MGSLRIGIIGARRHAQGIGEFIARDLAALGAEVCGIVGTSPPSVDEACRTLTTRYGISARGYLDASRMIETEGLEALAICSPHRFHREHLQTALEHRQHVLCEKPLVFDPDRDNVADARQCLADFQHAGRLLMVNHQWPYTLNGFDRCYPDVCRAGQVREFEMLLAPAQDGIRMIPDALPHVASMLLAVAPADGRTEYVRCTRSQPGKLRLEFQYVHGDGLVDVRVCLVQCPQPPRPAAYAINGCTVARRIELPGYRFYLQPIDQLPSGPARQDAQLVGNATGCVPLEDPLRLLAADFIRQVQHGESATRNDACLLQNVRIVQEIYEAVRQARIF